MEAPYEVESENFFGAIAGGGTAVVAAVTGIEDDSADGEGFGGVPLAEDWVEDFEDVADGNPEFALGTVNRRAEPVLDAIESDFAAVGFDKEVVIAGDVAVVASVAAEVVVLGDVADENVSAAFEPSGLERDGIGGGCAQARQDQPAKCSTKTLG